MVVFEFVKDKDFARLISGDDFQNSVFLQNQRAVDYFEVKILTEDR